jgi:hypothetical protein
MNEPNQITESQALRDEGLENFSILELEALARALEHKLERQFDPEFEVRARDTIKACERIVQKKLQRARAEAMRKEARR